MLMRTVPSSIAVLPAAGDKGAECGANRFKLHNRIGEVRIDADGRKSDLVFVSRTVLLVMVSARPLRIEYEGVVYHVTARGNARSDICDG